jgi:hypothetical protein
VAQGAWQGCEEYVKESYAACDEEQGLERKLLKRTRLGLSVKGVLVLYMLAQFGTCWL